MHLTSCSVPEPKRYQSLTSCRCLSGSDTLWQICSGFFEQLSHAFYKQYPCNHAIIYQFQPGTHAALWHVYRDMITMFMSLHVYGPWIQGHLHLYYAAYFCARPQTTKVRVQARVCLQQCQLRSCTKSCIHSVTSGNKCVNSDVKVVGNGNRDCVISDDCSNDMTGKCLC